MDMMEFLRTRRTYRRFDQRPIAPEILTEAIDAARLASCGANRQTVRYILCLLYTSPSPRDYAASRMPSSA